MKALFKKNIEVADKKVIIFGIDEEAVLTFAVLLQNEIYVYSFCDPEDREIGLMIMNKPVISLKELLEQKEEAILIVGGSNYLKQAETLEKEEGIDVFYDFNRAAYEGNSVLLMEDVDCD